MTILADLHTFTYSPVSSVDSMRWSPGPRFAEVTYGTLWVMRHTATDAAVVAVEGPWWRPALAAYWVPVPDLVGMVRSSRASVGALRFAEPIGRTVLEEPTLLHPDPVSGRRQVCEHGIPERLSNAAALLAYRAAIPEVLGERCPGALAVVGYPDAEPTTENLSFGDIATAVLG